MSGWGLAWIIAFRELRSVTSQGFHGFRIMVLCLALGVAAIAAVGAAQRTVENGITRDAKSLTGGDIEVRLLYREALQEHISFFGTLGQVARTAELRTMARLVGRAQLVSLKAVDAAYPLFGALNVDPPLTNYELFAPRGDVYGAAVEQVFLDTSGLKLGDRFRLNKVEFEARAVITREPDRGMGLMAFGPRVMINHKGLEATGLVLPGSLVTWYYRLRLPEDLDAKKAAERITERFGDPGWRLRVYNEAVPDLKRAIQRLSLFLTFASLAALLVGGVGVAGSVKAYLDERARTVAILKCMGAGANLIFKTYIVQIGLIALLATVVGAAAGSAAPIIFGTIIGDTLKLTIKSTFAFEPFLLALAYGLLTAFVFAAWPLAAAEKLQAAELVRGGAFGISGIRPSRKRLVLIALAAALLIGIAVFKAASTLVAISFISGVIVSGLLFCAVSILLIRSVRTIPRFGGPLWRLALSGVSRPGAPTLIITLSLGLGLSALTATTLTEAAFRHQLDKRISEDAPTFFFVDIQPYQRSAFKELLRKIPNVTLDSEAPMLRARITRINGVFVGKAKIKDGVRWATQNERGLTFSTQQPKNVKLVAGNWWSIDYAGPPLISFDAQIASGFGVGVGDTLSFNVLGREITATIQNLRSVNYGSLAMNFSTIFDSASLNAMPHTVLATASASPEMEASVIQAVTNAFPNVTVVRVKDIIAAAYSIVTKIGNALSIVAIVAVVAGALTLAGAVSASHNRRVADAVLLKTAGASRIQIVAAHAMEFALVGILTSALSVAIGAIGSWGIVTFLLRITWHFSWSAAAVPVGLALVLAMGMGCIGIWRALSVPAGTLLRNA